MNRLTNYAQCVQMKTTTWSNAIDAMDGTDRHEVEYIRNVLSVSGTLKYADSGTA